MFLKRIEQPTVELHFENGLIQSPDTIHPISYITFSPSFTIHQLSGRLIYEAYFIFGEFSDDRKLISPALVLLLTVTQSQSRQSWNCFNIPLVSARCWYSSLSDNSRAIRKDQVEIPFIFILTFSFFKTSFFEFHVKALNYTISTICWILYYYQKNLLCGSADVKEFVLNTIVLISVLLLSLERTSMSCVSFWAW